MCRKQPGIAIGRLCEKCDGKCVICVFLTAVDNTVLFCVITTWKQKTPVLFCVVLFCVIEMG